MLSQAQIQLGYFKQGDDLYEHLSEHEQNVPAALRAHAQRMQSAKEHLEKISKRVAQAGSHAEISIDADTHHIAISGPADFIIRLIQDGLAELPFYEDECKQCDRGYACGNCPVPER